MGSSIGLESKLDHATSNEDRNKHASKLKVIGQIRAHASKDSVTKGHPGGKVSLSQLNPQLAKQEHFSLNRALCPR